MDIVEENRFLDLKKVELRDLPLYLKYLILFIFIIK